MFNVLCILFQQRELPLCDCWFHSMGDGCTFQSRNQCRLMKVAALYASKELESLHALLILIRRLVLKKFPSVLNVCLSCKCITGFNFFRKTVISTKHFRIDILINLWLVRLIVWYLVTEFCRTLSSFFIFCEVLLYIVE